MGSGTSHGVPMIGCNCSVCTSDNPLNRRSRPSIAVRSDSGAILIDTAPELRLQSIACGLNSLDAVLYTHSHADHLMGLDDLRRFNDISGRELPIYADAATLEDIQHAFRYVFTPTQAGGGKPRLSLHEIQPGMCFSLCGIDIESMYVYHGQLPVLSYLFTNPVSGSTAAYVTDVSRIPHESMQRLYGLSLLILDAVRYEPHPTHFGLWQALEIIEELKPELALLTHLSHRFDHNTLIQETPPHVAPAYDGLCITLL